LLIFNQMKKNTFPIIPALTQSFTQTECQFYSKSYDLFAKRGVIALAHCLLSREKYEEWFGQALSLQLTIYGLDLYYEGHAKIRSAEEDLLWERVERELRSGWRPNNDLLWESFADVQLYADVERRIHEGDPIDLREFAYIARLKCADVRMARGLIWMFNGEVDPRALRYYGIYDQCWELIEDVFDIEEDGVDWNFNFWLYAFMAGKDPKVGISAARQVLWLKVAELEEAYSRLPSQLSDAMSGSYHSTILAATLAGRCRRRVFAAISRGRVVRFGEQIESAA
jgi:hypothetical protein